MKAKVFSYKVEGVFLQPAGDNLKTSDEFDRKELLAKVKDLFKEQGFQIDEHSVDYKITDGQLYIEGLAVENQQAKSIGFLTGK